MKIKLQSLFLNSVVSVFHQWSALSELPIKSSSATPHLFSPLTDTSKIPLTSLSSSSAQSGTTCCRGVRGSAKREGQQVWGRHGPISPSADAFQLIAPQPPAAASSGGRTDGRLQTDSDFRSQSSTQQRQHLLLLQGGRGAAQEFDEDRKVSWIHLVRSPELGASWLAEQERGPIGIVAWQSWSNLRGLPDQLHVHLNRRPRR